MLGSANLDNMSLLNNYEHEIAGTNEEFTAALEKNAVELIKMSRPLNPGKHATSFKERLLGVLVRPIHRFL